MASFVENLKVIFMWYQNHIMKIARAAGDKDPLLRNDKLSTMGLISRTDFLCSFFERDARRIIEV